MKKINWKQIYLIILGFFALIWFLVRVIPKPSRAAYPCQRAAFPLASAFVLWLTATLSSAMLFVQFKKNIRKNKLAYASLFIVLFGFSIVLYAAIIPTGTIFAKNQETYYKPFWEGRIPLVYPQNQITTAFDEVAIVQSEKAHATDINLDDIESMVREAVDLAGGIDALISNGDYVVLKPNLVEMPPSPTPEYVEVGGIATDWRVVKAVAKMVRELNPDGKIYIIESSSATSTREVLNYYNYTLENIPEVDQIVALEDSCGAWEDYNDPHLDQVYLNDTVRLYPDDEKPNLSPEFYINKIYNRADVVISIPVLKNHKVAIITGGVKNVAIGMTPPNIYGMSPTFFGKWTKIDHGLENLNKWLHDFYLCKPVDFVIVDGLQGFDHGPTGLEGLTMEEMQHNMRLIIAGRKALSVDAVCGNIMSIDPTFAPYMVYLDKEAYGVGTIDSRFIRLKGKPLSAIREIFPHNEEIVMDAIYTDYTPPEIELISSSIDGTTITLNLNYDDDLDKLELKVNGEWLHQICVDDFATVSFEVEESQLPIDSLTIIANDRFFNETRISVDYTNISETNDPVTAFKNYPNPFGESTTIAFELTHSAKVRLYVTDMQGRIVENMLDKTMPAGNHQYTWQAPTEGGTYLGVLDIDGKQFTIRMIKK